MRLRRRFSKPRSAGPRPPPAPTQTTRTAQTAEVQVRATPVREIPQPTRAASDEAPQKILRPGSLLDIRV